MPDLVEHDDARRAAVARAQRFELRGPRRRQRFGPAGIPQQPAETRNLRRQHVERPRVEHEHRHASRAQPRDLRRPEAGSVRYGDRDVAALTRREQAGLRCYLAETTTDYFPATALDIALSGRHPHLSRWQWEGADDVARARRALAAFGVETCAERDVATLSGGERRRVALAAMLAQDAPLLLLDEPSSHLDLGQQIAAFDVLTGHARATGAAIVMVVHDLHLALRYADHAIAIGGGSARAGAAAEALTAEALSTLFGRRLVAVGEGSARTLVPA